MEPSFHPNLLIRDQQILMKAWFRSKEVTNIQTEILSDIHVLVVLKYEEFN